MRSSVKLSPREQHVLAYGLIQAPRTCHAVKRVRYRRIGVHRVEPDSKLFAIPAGYKMVESFLDRLAPLPPQFEDASPRATSQVAELGLWALQRLSFGHSLRALNQWCICSSRSLLSFLTMNIACLSDAPCMCSDNL
jgi:hypothetical protein